MSVLDFLRTPVGKFFTAWALISIGVVACGVAEKVGG